MINVQTQLIASYKLNQNSHRVVAILDAADVNVRH